MKKILFEIYVITQRAVGFTGWTFEIFRTRPNKKWKTTYVEAISGFMHLDLSESLDGTYAQGIVDELCVDYLKANIKAESVFIDVGANQGFYSLLALNYEPKIKVVAVEPDPYSLTKLRKNLELNNICSSQITIVESALGSADTNLDLLINDIGNRSGSSFVINPHKDVSRKTKMTTISVPVTTLFTLIRKLQIHKIDVLKIDIEGFEFPVLEKYFQEAPGSLWPKSIIIEAHGSSIDLVGGSPINLLFANGYKIYRHEEYNYIFELDE